MSVETPTVFINESLNDDEESIVTQNDQPVVGDEEEVFYDASEDVTENSLDIASPDTNNSVTNEDLPTDTRDHSELDECHVPFRAKDGLVKPMIENFNDVSTEAASSCEGNDFPPLVRTLSFYDDDEATEENTRDTMENFETEDDEIPATSIMNNDVVSPNRDVDECHSEHPKSSDQDYVLQVPVNGRHSSMEIMDDDSDGSSSKLSSAAELVAANKYQADDEKLASNDGGKDREAANVEIVENVDEMEKVSDSRFENEKTAAIVNESPKDVQIEEVELSKVDKVSLDATDEVLAMDDDSDVDQSFLENLDVALKVVEASSPAQSDASSAKTELQENLVDAANETDVTSAKSEPESNAIEETLQQEFRDNSLQMVSGQTKTRASVRLCSCQVVLPKIDFDEKFGRLHNSAAQISPSSTNGNQLSTDSDNSFSYSVKTPRKSSLARGKAASGRVKLVRKNILSSSESGGTETASRGSARLASSTSTNSSPIVSNRPRRKLNAQIVYSSSSESDDFPLIQFNKNKKHQRGGAAKNSTAVVEKSTKKNSINEKKKKSSPWRKTSASVVAATDEVDEAKNQTSRLKTLRCVSLPRITSILKSLKENSYQELLELMEEKMRRCEEASSTFKENISVRRRNCRKKLSCMDSDSSSVNDDSEYKIYSKLWKSDEGSPRPAASVSLRKKIDCPATKKSVRESKRVQSYAESSDSDIFDELPAKKAKRSTKNTIQDVWNGASKNVDCSSTETENSLNEDRRHRLRRNVHTTRTTRIRT